MAELNAGLAIASGAGMIFVGASALITWRLISRTPWRWFWVGAGLWAVAVLVKLCIGLLVNGSALGWFRHTLAYPAYIALGGVFIGLESSLCEIGIIIAAAAWWRQLGRDANRAIAIGVGAGAVEALLLGAFYVGAGTFAVTGLPGGADIAEGLGEMQSATPLFWLVGPVERLLAMLVHVSSRALALLGVTYTRSTMVYGGLALFATVDGIAGAAILLGNTSIPFSPWWIELAISPIALLSVWVLRRCSQIDAEPG
jgi:hypothetical protein